MGRPSWADDPAPTSAPPAQERPSWAGGASAPSSAPSTPERPSWAGGPAAKPTSVPPAPSERPSWSGAASATPTSGPPLSSGTPPLSSAGTPPAPERPSWAGPGPTSAPPAPPERPSWASDPTPTSTPPAPAGPSPSMAERPGWAGGPPSIPTSAGASSAERPDWSEGRIRPAMNSAAAADRPSWAGGRPASAGRTSPRGADAGDPPRPESRAGQPFRLRPESPESPGPAPVEPPTTSDPSPTSTGEPPTAAGPVPTSATSGSGRRDRTLPAPAPTSAPPYAARRSAPDPASPADPADDDRQPDRTSAVLPQRVPAEPDVPIVPEPPAVEPPAETPQLARIATHLRREDEPAPPQERPEGFDVNAILDAVRGVPGVRDAALRRTPAGAHSLRLDLADGADPAEVSRQVARLLQDRMGLAAAPQNLPGPPTTPVPAARRRAAEPRGNERRSTEPRDAVTGSRGASSEGPTGELTTSDGSSVAGRGGRAGAKPVDPDQWGGADTQRRRRPGSLHRGRATVEEPGSVSAAPSGPATGSPATVGTSYSGGQVTTTESAPSRPLDTGGNPGPRVVIDHVQVSTFGLDANVEVRLLAAGESAAGHATGPAVDGYVLRLCAVAAAAAVDELLRGGGGNAERGRCFVEHAAVVPFGNCEVATVVVLLVCDGWVEQLAGSALVAGDPRQAVVRATLAAVNRRLEALLS
ncbi:hypothetical protein ACFOW4_17330 [Micromonospora sp. GCM10011542]|uniref:hypothetical protein n=1 Tax=Micromonospora sp. GCM10011542 TaxID=3317337 RepID=UPI0036191403